MKPSEARGLGRDAARRARDVARDLMALYKADLRRISDLNGQWLHYQAGYWDEVEAMADDVAVANPPRGVRIQKVVPCLERGPKAGARKIEQPSDVAEVLADYIALRPTEYFIALYVDIRNNQIGYSEFTGGDITGVTVNPSSIMRDGLLIGAAGFVTAHQHPSGDPTPSDDDRALWRRLRAVGELMGIANLDNLVLGEEGFYSEAENATTPYRREVYRAIKQAAER